MPIAPGSLATAKHRAIDLWRRNKRLVREHEELGRALEIRHETVRQISQARSMMKAQPLRRGPR